MPWGCNEQTFNRFIPNVAVYQYLNNTKKLTTTSQDRIKKHLEIGYQLLLTIKNSDGSLSFFKDSPKSLWLTAYVAKLLAYINTVIHVDPSLVFNALNFLNTSQVNGTFTDEDFPYYRGHQNKKIYVTAYVLIAFLENSQEYQTTFNSTIESSFAYLKKEVSKITDNHVKAMIAYAFSLKQNKAEAENFLEDLVKNAEPGDNMHWHQNKKNPGEYQVETAAYALLALVNVGSMTFMTKAISVVNWLSTQRNSNGGFHSTTDTVLGIQALAKFASEFMAPENDMSVKIKYQKGMRDHEKTLTISSKNKETVNCQKFGRAARNFSLQAYGKGFTYLRLTQMFTEVTESLPKTLFDLSAVATNSTDGKYLNVEVCVSKKDKQPSGMALIEIELPSGFVYDNQTLKTVNRWQIRASETFQSIDNVY